MKNLLKLILLFLIVGIVALLYAVYVEPYRFTIHKETIRLSTSVTNSFTIVQLSDIEIAEHYSEGELEKHIEEINALSPDIIVFTGDLFNNYAKYGPYEEVQAMLSSLEASIGKYAIYGNKDYGGGAVRVYEQLMQDAGFTILRNSVIQVNIKGTPIQLVGTDSYLMGAFDQTEIKQELKDTIPTIVLAHEPEIIDSIEFTYDLLLAGHTHGGQIAIPFLQRLFHISETPYQKGLYQIGEQQIYVDSGLGTSRIPIRFLNPPQVSYLTIEF